MLVGSAVPSRDPLGDVARLGMDVAQVHLSAPRNWAAPKAREDAEQLAASGAVVAAHASYLVNPASATARVRQRSWEALRATAEAAAAVGAQGVVVHAGQAGADGTVDQAVQRWVEGITDVVLPVPLLLENTAAGNAAPGRHLDDLVRLVAEVRAATRTQVGVCLDTCHAFAGDPAVAGDPGGWTATLREGVGGIDLLHVNDSVVPAGAGRDNHAALGDGRMGLDALAAMVRAARAPAAVLETPGDDDDRRRADLALLRSWAAD